MVTGPGAQDGYRLRFGWGLGGAREVSGGAALAVVDVLSFTTTLTVAVERGVEVFPYRWRDGSARAFAAERDAVLAIPRDKAQPGDVSLSPGTVRSAAGLRRLVLPSPNGATVVRACVSGRELIAGGYSQDVEVATEVDTSSVVPLLDGDGFRDAAA